MPRTARWLLVLSLVVALSVILGDQVLAQQTFQTYLPGVETWSCDGTSRWADTADFRYQVLDQTGQPRILETTTLHRTGEDEYHLPLEITSLPEGEYKIRAYQRMPICLSYELSGSEEFYTADFSVDIPTPLYWPEGQANWARNPEPVKSACCTWVQSVVIVVAVLLLLVSPFLIVLVFWPGKNSKYRLKCLFGGLSAFVAMLFLTWFVSIMTGPIEQSTETITRSFSFEVDASDIAPGQHLFSETLEGFQNAYANVQATHISETAHMYGFLPTGEVGFRVVSDKVDKVYLATAPPIREDWTFAVEVSVQNKSDNVISYPVTLECKRENQLTFNETIEVEVPPEAYKAVEFKLAHIGAGEHTCSSGGEATRFHVFEAPYLALLKVQHTLDIGQPLVIEGNTNLGSAPYFEGVIKVRIKAPNLETAEKEVFADIYPGSRRFAAEFETESLSEGVYQVIVAYDAESLKEQADLKLIRRYADIQVRDLKLDPTVFVGDKTNGVLTLKNTGNDSGIFPVVIRLEEQVVMSEGVKVGAGELLQIPVHFIVAAPGEYVVWAGELSEHLIVRAVPWIKIKADSSIMAGDRLKVLGTSNLPMGDSLKVELCISHTERSPFCISRAVSVGQEGRFQADFPTDKLDGLFDITAAHAVWNEEYGAKDIQSIDIYTVDAPKPLEYLVSFEPGGTVDAREPVNVKITVHNSRNTSATINLLVKLDSEVRKLEENIELEPGGTLDRIVQLGQLEPGNYIVNVNGWEKWLRVLKPIRSARNDWVFSNDDIYVNLNSTETRLTKRNRSFKLTASAINKSEDELSVYLILITPPGLQFFGGFGCTTSPCVKRFLLEPDFRGQAFIDMELSISEGSPLGLYEVQLEYRYERPGDAKLTEGIIEGSIYYIGEP